MAERDGAAFLQQAHRNNWQQYLASLAPGSRLGWDLCILTASDERQAAMYRRMLDWRAEAALLPARTQFRVVPDPGGRRIGSGGATLRVLAGLAAGGEAEQCVLVIHSGGDSKRLPHCSATGKLFARVPRALPDGRASTIFDEFLIALSGLAAGLPAGVLVVSGDVLLVFDHLQLTFRRAGVTGVAAAAPAEMGLRHGVYATSVGSRQVRAYLHKLGRCELERRGAIHADGTVDIDTGLVWLDAPTVAGLASLAQEPAVATLAGLDDSAPDPGAGLNLYGDLLLPLAESTGYEAYSADTSDGPATPEVRAAREVLWPALRGTPFTAERLQPGVFVHFGTTQEYWRMVADPALGATCGWQAQTAAWPEAPAEGLRLVSAAVEGAVEPGAQPALVVDSCLSGRLAWQGGAVIAGVQSAEALALAEDVVLHQLPLGAGHVTRLYGLRDDPKRRWDDPGATYLNKPWAEWLAAAGVAPEDLWPGEAERSLWNARLFPVDEREASLALALPLQDPAAGPAGWRERWLAAERVSLAEGFHKADGAAILAELAEVEDHVAARRFYGAVLAERPAAEAKELLGGLGAAVARRCGLAASWLAEDEPVVRLRGYKALAVASGDEAWEDTAFATLAGMISPTAKEPPHPTGEREPGFPMSRDKEELAPSRHPSDSTHAAMKLERDPSPPRGEGQGEGVPTSGRPAPVTVRVEAAARIDFGGGWTDTPPYSIEMGGTVLNAAITLRGRYPIWAEAAWLEEPVLLLESRDIEATVAPATAGEVLGYADPADPFALLKAALVLRGIVPPGAEPALPVADLLRERGGGLRVSTGTSIPRGSGLGTSSILAGAVLAALGRLLRTKGPEGSEGYPDHSGSLSQLFDEVLCLEQMLTTGGGWQDQVGGLTGGIKLITTAPGLPQRIRVEPLELSAETQQALSERLLLVYTGQQRLAKNLLRAVMGRWLARDPEMVWILRRIAELAVAMRQALEAGNLDSFGGLLAEHWELQKRMDPGCTNPFIDGLFEAMAPHVCGGKVAGAGGGGFAMVVARSGGDIVESLWQVLEARYSGTGVAPWPSTITTVGVSMSVPVSRRSL